MAFVCLDEWVERGDAVAAYAKNVHRRAVARGTEFSLPLGFIRALAAAQGHRCVLSGLPIGFSYVGPRRRLSCTASLDRIDSAGGYTVGNVQFLHREINRMKGGLSDAEFVNLCRLVVEHAARAA